jgi:hypothetical protein
MSEVETLLSVDAGKVPPGTLVFPARDPEAPTRKLYAMLGIMVLALALGCGLTGAGRAPVALLLLAASMLLIWATPTASEIPEPKCKPAMLVVTPTGIIVRDAGGLRTWQFADLAEALPFIHYGRVGVLVIEKNGSRDFIENLLFQRGENLREVIHSHLDHRAAA